MALIHEQLTYSGRLAEIDFAQYVDRLVRYLVDGYGADPARIQTIADVDVMLTLDQAVPCGLILQELISNTLKHAFPDGAAGKIWIEFHDRNGTYVLRYRDNGVGLPPSFDIRRTQSLGTQLISDLTAQLGAEARYSSSAGLSVELMFAARERQSDSSLA
jgi:two-component sensor histidine kinase